MRGVLLLPTAQMRRVRHIKFSLPDQDHTASKWPSQAPARHLMLCCLSGQASKHRLIRVSGAIPQSFSDKGECHLHLKTGLQMPLIMSKYLFTHNISLPQCTWTTPALSCISVWGCRYEPYTCSRSQFHGSGRQRYFYKPLLSETLMHPMSWMFVDWENGIKWSLCKRGEPSLFGF